MSSVISAVSWLTRRIDAARLLISQASKPSGIWLVMVTVHVIGVKIQLMLSLQAVWVGLNTLMVISQAPHTTMTHVNQSARFFQFYLQSEEKRETVISTDHLVCSGSTCTNYQNPVGHLFLSLVRLLIKDVPKSLIFLLFAEIQIHAWVWFLCLFNKVSGFDYLLLTIIVCLIILSLVHGF